MLKISEYLNLVKKKSKNESDTNIIKYFEKELIDSKIEDIIVELKTEIIQNWGKLLDRGPDKGRYFMRLRKELPNINPRSLSLSMSPKETVL